MRNETETIRRIEVYQLYLQINDEAKKLNSLLFPFYLMMILWSNVFSGSSINHNSLALLLGFLIN